MQGLAQPSPTSALRRSPTATRREVMTSSPSWYTPSTPTRSVGGPYMVTGSPTGTVVVQTPSRPHASIVSVPCAMGSPLHATQVYSPASSMPTCPSPAKSPTVRSAFALPTRVVEGISSAPGPDHTWRAVAGAVDGIGSTQPARKSRQPASSSASTQATSGNSDISPSDDSSSRDEAAANAPQEQEQPPWAITQTVRLCTERDREELVGKAKIMDPSHLNSVKSAIEQLNRGTLPCHEGLCVVYSASSLCHYLLYRQDKKEFATAFARMHGKEAAPRPPQTGSIAAFVTPQGLQLPIGEVVRSFQPTQSLEDIVWSFQPSQHSLEASPEASPSASPPPTLTRRDTLSQTRSCQDALSQTRSSQATPCWSTGTPAHQSPSLTSRPSRGRVSTPNRMRCWSPGGLLPGCTTPSRLSTAPGSPKVGTVVIGSRTTGMHGASPSVARSRRSLPGPAARAPSSPPAQDRAGEPAANVFTPRTSKRSLATSRTPQASPHLNQSMRKMSISPPAFAEEREAATRAAFRATNEVEIGDSRFELSEVVGRGAFGVVWRARKVQQAEGEHLSSREEDSAVPDKEVAVKVVSAKDGEGFVAAAFEAELLQILTAACSRYTGHVPRYFAHSATRSNSGPSASNGGTVRLAMSFVPGGALDKWLYGISDEEHKTVEVAQLIDGQIPGGQQGVWTLAGASSIVRDLLIQLCGVFAALQPIAFHRDVSSHNVLVDFPEGPERPDFALIDFGLAVRSGSWSREWRTSNLAGDPRYWTPSAWMAFAFGFKYVATHPNSGFEQQYLSRLDHFSMGILGLETLFALWRSSDAREGKHPGLLGIRAAWARYWASIIRLFQMFHLQGAQEVRHFLSQSQEEGITQLVDNLRQLRQAARAAARRPENRGCGALLLVLADLIDEKGTVAWSEISPMLSEDIRTEAGTPSPKASREAGASSRGAAALTEDSPSPTFERAPHSRIRSTGETLDQELRRLEPEASAAASCPRPRGRGESLSPDPITRSYSHVRRSTNHL